MICLFIYGLVMEPSPQSMDPFTDLLYQPWIKYAEDCRANSGISDGGETEVLGENLSQCLSVQHRSHMT
jgi:hypothetical protein